MENWKEVVCNPNYEVSDTGRVRRCGSVRDRAVRDRKGYLALELHSGGKRSTKSVHRLVAEAFIPNPDNKPEVNHLDGDKHNNVVSNLEWTTTSENCQHAYDTGLRKPSYGMLGKTNPNGGLKRRRIRVIETGEIYGSLKECEQAINGNNRHINDCLRGRLKSHRGLHFEYAYEDE